MHGVGDSETIRTLNLSWNHLRRKGAEAIAEGLKVWDLTELVSIIISIIQVNAAVSELLLAYNGFADKGMAALADTLKVNGTLRELDVRLCMTHTL